MTEPSTLRWQETPPRHRAVHLLRLCIVAIAALTFFAAGAVIDEPVFVDRLIIENPTSYDVMVHVTDRRRTGWLAAGTVAAGEVAALEQILDQGDVWILRFTAQGREAGEHRLTRRELEASDWNVYIPVAVGDELRRQGVSSAPESPG